jgi:uncharacterized membrane protein YhhN
VTGPAAFLLGMAAVFAVADWVAVARGRKALEYVAKPATTILLLGVAATLVPEDETRRLWFLAALVLSLGGDEQVPRQHQEHVAAVGTPILRAVLGRGERELVGPVVAYMAVISVMVACALGTGDPVAAGGAALFLLSDSLIAWNRFVRPLAWAPVTIMVTYHLAQTGLVLSLLA